MKTSWTNEPDQAVYYLILGILERFSACSLSGRLAMARNWVTLSNVPPSINYTTTSDTAGSTYHATYGHLLDTTIRAVAGQRSSPDFRFVTKSIKSTTKDIDLIVTQVGCDGTS